MGRLNALATGWFSQIGTSRMAKLDYDPPVGAALRAIRKERGYTIEEAASRGKVTANYLGDVERGPQNPSIKVVSRILAGLHVTWTEFGTVLDRTGAAGSPATSH